MTFMDLELAHLCSLWYLGSETFRERK